MKLRTLLLKGRGGAEPINFSHERRTEKYLGHYQDRTVTVSQPTFQDLQLAQKVIARTCALLPFGAGNQVADVFASEGESFLRAGYAAAKGGGSTPRNAAMSVQAQAGNCSGHADVAYLLLSEESTGRPVGRARSNVADHAFVVIGDYRDPRQDTVVLDAWSAFPSAFLLRDADMSLIGPAPSIVEWQPVDRSFLKVDDLEKIQMQKIIRFFSELGVKEPGSKLKRQLLEMHAKNPFFFNQWHSIANPATTYRSAESGACLETDRVMRATYDRRINGFKKAAASGFTR